MKTIVRLMVVSLLMVLIAGTGFGWGNATHTYCAKNLTGAHGHLGYNEMYGAVVTDAFNLMLDESSTHLPFFITNVAIGNGQFHGGGMRPCPAAVPNDGIFDVTVIEYAGALRLLSSISMLYSGEVYAHPKVRHFEAARITAEAGKATEIEIDGEPLGTLPLEVTILPRQLRVLVSPSSSLAGNPELAAEGTTAPQKK